VCTFSEGFVKLSQAIPVGISLALPGCGHIAAGRHLKGLLLFFLFGFAVDGVLYGQAKAFLRPDQPTPTACTVALFLGIGLWGYALADTVALVRRAGRVAASASVADAHVRQALVAYLANDLDAASAALRSALRLDPTDADTLFYFAVVLAHTGRPRHARRFFRRCLRWDREGKWEAEVQAQLRALDAGGPVIAPPHPHPPGGSQPPGGSEPPTGTAPGETP
jgi:tetratricopeptide (TPR) repeat protein